MKRKVVSLLIITLPVLLVAILLQLPVAGAPAGQSTPATADDTALRQPQQIVIRQQIPLSFTIAAPAAVTNGESTTNTTNLLGALVNSITRSTNQTTTASAQTVVVTLTLDLQLTVTDTLTTTVPSTVTLTLADESITAPVTVTVGPAPQAAVVITLLPPVTTTTALTATATLTTAAEVTATTASTTPIIGPAVALTGTVAITANLRSGPDTTFEAVGAVAPGQIVTVVAQNAESTWYLVNNGAWIASFLIENLQGQLPLATEALVTTIREQAVLTPTPTVTTTAVTTTTPVTATATVTATTAITSAESATATTSTTATTTGVILVPTPSSAPQAGQPAQPPTVTVDANLRSGPATTFPIIGGTITGQEINIVARNEDGSWFRLDNGGWVAANLVANAPAATAVPLFTEEGESTAAPAATATPLPTPTTAPTNTTPTNTTPVVLGVRENLYTIRVDGIADGYDFTLTKIDELVSQADGDVALLKDRAWIVEMTTAITLLRSTSEEVNALTAPPLFADAHAILQDAATAFSGAADLLAEGVDELDTDRLDQAFAQITTGTTLLTRAQAAVEEATP